MSSDTPESALPPPTLPPGAPPVDDALPGMKLGDYVVEKAVAWGGMGIVYRAVHPLLGRSVAVKVLRPNFASDPEQAARFLKEAQAISAINHRGIIDIISFGNLPDGRQYMVMEFLEGETLEEVMKREGAMSPVRALTLVEEVLDALSAAHKVGVVHRDLKPSNVYITMQSNGASYVKLVDFGLARRAPLGDLKRIDEKASLMAGTPEYLSPEQVKGLAATPRTDLYSLGVMLFEMVTGELPFAAGSVLELLNAHRIETAPRASTRVASIPAMLDDLIANCLQKAPELRPSSAESARGTVQRILRQLKDDNTQVNFALRPPPVEGARREKATAGVDTERVAAVRLPAQTQPGVGGRRGPSVLWAGAAGLLVSAIALVAVFWPAPAAQVVPAPVVPLPAAVAPVEPPPRPPTAPALAEPATPGDAELTPLPPKKVPPPPRKEPAPARRERVAAPLAPEDVPEACLGRAKDNLGDLSAALLRQYAARLAGAPANPEHQRELDLLTRRIAAVNSVGDCVQLLEGFKAWKLKYIGK